jgi:hypothetical protein
MDFFNEYLKGKRFILYTNHKTLEKLGHLHSKTLNRLQTALLEHDFVIQYKKGSNMPADYLSRLKDEGYHCQHFRFRSILSRPVRSPDARQDAADGTNFHDQE